MTSALISPRLRKIGRSFLNAIAMDPANASSSATVPSVSLRVQRHQDAEGDDRREQPAHELDQPRAHQVPDALRVGHDPGDQHAGLGRVEVAHGQPQHVRLHVLAHASRWRPAPPRSPPARAENEVAACTSAAPAAASTSHVRSSGRFWPMTSSMRNLGMAGITSPASRLTIISDEAERRACRGARAPGGAASARTFLKSTLGFFFLISGIQRS